jgi:uncharacterized protein HemX
MDNSSPSSPASPPLLPWLALAVVVILAAGGALWFNQKIDSVQAAAAPRQEIGANETQVAIASLKQAIAEIQADQQKLGEQVSQVQRAVATNQGERKLLSEQVGALSSRVDALASSSAEATPRQQPQGTNRRR